MCISWKRCGASTAHDERGRGKGTQMLAHVIPRARQTCRTEWLSAWKPALLRPYAVNITAAHPLPLREVRDAPGVTHPNTNTPWNGRGRSFSSDELLFSSGGLSLLRRYTHCGVNCTGFISRR